MFMKNVIGLRHTSFSFVFFIFVSLILNQFQCCGAVARDEYLVLCQRRIADDFVGEMWFMVYFLLWVLIYMLNCILNLRSFFTSYDLSNCHFFLKNCTHLVGQFLIIYLLVKIVIKLDEFYELKEDLATFNAEREWRMHSVVIGGGGGF